MAGWKCNDPENLLFLEGFCDKLSQVTLQNRSLKRNSVEERQRRRSSQSRPAYPFASVITPTDLLWALIGLILTIGGTFLEASITNAPWHWGQEGVQSLALGVSYQIGAMLLVACLGGRNAAVIAQIAYLLLGLTWLDVFTFGSGFDYVHRPSFGYLLGFVPAAWVTGTLAFRLPVRLEFLGFSCLSGLATVHLFGMGYLAIAHHFNWLNQPAPPLLQSLITFSLQLLPGQLVVVCAVTVLAFIFRNLMFY